jgi:hypothetical protein
VIKLLDPVSVFLIAVAVSFLLQSRRSRRRPVRILEQLASIPLVIGGAYFLHLMLIRLWPDYAALHPPVLYLLGGAFTGWAAGILSSSIKQIKL